MRSKLIKGSKALRKTINRIDELGQGGDRLFESCRIMLEVTKKMPPEAKMKILRQAGSIACTKDLPEPKGPKSDTSQ